MKSRTFLIIIFLIFIASRVAVLDFPYHQDETKWLAIAESARLNHDHPPLQSILFYVGAKIVGFDKLRLVPIAASLLLILLVYALCRRLCTERAARWATIILLINPYSFIASAQIDIDGALLPLFSVLAVYCYYRIDWNTVKTRQNYLWLGALGAALVLGMLTKLSFVLIVIALLTEYYLSFKPSLRQVFKYFWLLILVIAVTWALVLLSGLFLPNLYGAGSFLLDKVSRFSNFNLLDRNYLQTFFLSVKTIIVASPLLIGFYGILLALGRNEMKKYRLWLIFMIYSLLFYYVIFDFSHGGTIERYLMFLIAPGAIIGGGLISRLIGGINRGRLVFDALAIALSAFSFSYLATFLPKILPLQPKTDYINAVRNFDFNFLIPITGGSGPNGFYVMAGFVAFAYVVSLIAVLGFVFLKKQDLKQFCFRAFLIVAVIYNLILSSEFMFGWQFGNVPNLTKVAVAAAVTDPRVPEVVTYYDIGRYELKSVNKYRARFFTDPMFQNNINKFSNYTGDFLVVNFPMINKDSVYWRYFESCKIIEKWNDKKVDAYIFDCKNGNRSLFYRGVAL